ncbi:uncharacterized protein EDB93DRAFT_1101256 [Suillus bovinus]|uniref:uncharacterized protein n=1 Tax=Suillus bovinus TaxID=48563 RepID=UPI001B868EAF|nr:uncharacterized protein EDB93DRAFT_1101256 [Suillus bovinus]KAG2156833.1 hypothetical protein EDB93DRAFT_1101256 [Suillus bovinus]
MYNDENEVVMRDYWELNNQEDDHIGNQDDDTTIAARVAEVQEPYASLANEASHNDLEDPILAVEKFPEAGRVLRINDTTHPTYTRTCCDLHMEDNPYHPFISECDYEIARWAIQQGPSQNAFSNFLSIDGISGINEEFELFMRDPVECIKELWANPAYLNHLTYALEHHFADEGKTEHIYDELMSGNWSWKVQLRQDPALQFRGDKTTYPVYLTIGNILKSICRRPSFCAQKIIGYLPTISLDGMDISVDSAHHTHVQLFYYTMWMVTSSLHAEALTNRIELISEDGAVHLRFPVLTAYVADYPEQALVMCTCYAQMCPKCFVTEDELGDHIPGDPQHQKESIHTICHASQQVTKARAEAAARDHGLNLILDPFWIGLLHCNIHDTITPDILHQIYQGLVKHIYFLEIAQYQSHTEATLVYLSDALDEFHTNKDVFINLGACTSEDFNFAKLHLLKHYTDSICCFGMTNNYNTEATEWLHIDYTKNMPLPPGIYLAKNPSAHAVPFYVLEDQFGATQFKVAIMKFIVHQLQPSSQRGQVSHNLYANILQDLTAVDMWYHIKFVVPNLQVDTEFVAVHTAHTELKRLKSSGIGELDTRFDTILINESGCESKATGIDDEYVMKMSLPRQIGHLAYVEWFSQP